MDGFYDQQVPFVVSESVSVKDFMQIFRKEKVKCDWAVCLFFFFSRFSSCRNGTQKMLRNASVSARGSSWTRSWPRTQKVSRKRQLIIVRRLPGWFFWGGWNWTRPNLWMTCRTCDAFVQFTFALIWAKKNKNRNSVCSLSYVQLLSCFRALSRFKSASRNLDSRRWVDVLLNKMPVMQAFIFFF